MARLLWESNPASGATASLLRELMAMLPATLEREHVTPAATALLHKASEGARERMMTALSGTLLVGTITDGVMEAFKSCPSYERIARDAVIATAVGGSYAAAKIGDTLPEALDFAQKIMQQNAIRGLVQIASGYSDNTLEPSTVGMKLSFLAGATAISTAIAFGYLNATNTNKAFSATSELRRDKTEYQQRVAYTLLAVAATAYEFAYNTATSYLKALCGGVSLNNRQMSELSDQEAAIQLRQLTPEQRVNFDRDGLASLDNDPAAKEAFKKVTGSLTAVRKYRGRLNMHLPNLEQIRSHFLPQGTGWGRTAAFISYGSLIPSFDALNRAPLHGARAGSQEGTLGLESLAFGVIEAFMLELPGLHEHARDPRIYSTNTAAAGTEIDRTELIPRTARDLFPIPEETVMEGERPPTANLTRDDLAATVHDTLAPSGSAAAVLHNMRSFQDDLHAIAVNGRLTPFASLAELSLSDDPLAGDPLAERRRELMGALLGDPEGEGARATSAATPPSHRPATPGSLMRAHTASEPSVNLMPGVSRLRGSLRPTVSSEVNDPEAPQQPSTGSRSMARFKPGSKHQSRMQQLRRSSEGQTPVPAESQEHQRAALQRAREAGEAEAEKALIEEANRPTEAEPSDPTNHGAAPDDPEDERESGIS